MATISGRWATGNGRLAPASIAGEHVLFAGDRFIGALDRRQQVGQLLWRREIAPPGAMFRPRAAAGVVICGNGSGLAAYAPADGTVLWQRPAQVQIGTPALAGDLLCYGDGHEIIAADCVSGRERWRFAAVPDTLASYAPLIHDGMVFAAPGDGRLYALSIADGRLLWHIERMAEWQYLRQLHAGAGVLVAGSYKELLFGIAPDTGAILWRFNAGNFINSHHVADGVTYLWSPTGWIYAIDAASGRVLWRHRTTDYGTAKGNWGSLMAELVARHGQLYALAMDHVLHVLDLADGADRGRYTLPEPMRPFVEVEAADSVLLGTQSGDIVRLMLA